MLNYHQSYPSARSAVMGRAAAATSQPLATMAAMDMLNEGGNAVDAAIAAAMVLTVVEPTGCGLGSDAFAIVWDGQKLHGLNGSGRAPRNWTPERFAGHSQMPQRGWETVTVPGAVAAWADLLKKFGRKTLGDAARAAIGYARNGFPVTPIIAELWARGSSELKTQPGFAECFMPGGRAPAAGDVFRSEAHARSLEMIAETNGEAFYRGKLADRIVEAAAKGRAALTSDDFGEHVSEWVELLSQSYVGAVAHEIPPNGQGIATLMALGIMEATPFSGGVDSPDEIHLQIEATKLALADLNAYVADPPWMTLQPTSLLDAGYLASRAQQIDMQRAGDPGCGPLRQAGTVCLSVADSDGMMISFIQSNYQGFGSGVVVPETGISLQNRGAGFVLTPGHPNLVGSRKRPFHTIIPGFVTDSRGQPLMSFGLMGGPMQAQGHVQMINRIVKHRQNPQAAADAPRWRIISGRRVAVEPTMSSSVVESLRSRGHDIVIEAPDVAFAFGGAQIIVKGQEGYIAGSDPRKDGQASAR